MRDSANEPCPAAPPAHADRQDRRAQPQPPPPFGPRDKAPGYARQPPGSLAGSSGLCESSCCALPFPPRKEAVDFLCFPQSYACQCSTFLLARAPRSRKSTASLGKGPGVRSSASHVRNSFAPHALPPNNQWSRTTCAIYNKEDTCGLATSIPRGASLGN